MTALYLQLAEQRIGPLSRQDVQDGLGSGRFHAATMSWAEGERRWISLGRRFRIGRTRPWAGPVFLLLWAMMTFAGVVLPLDPYNLVPPALREPMAYVAITAACGLSAVAVLALWWRHPRDPSRPRPIAVFSAVALGLTLLASGGYLALRLRTENVRSQTSDARMAVSADGHRLLIEGGIGPHFVRDLDAALDRAPAVSLVEIESPGGLIDNALEAGHRLAQRNLRVRVSGECASACVLLWASAPRRELGLRALVGLHQARLDDDVPDSWKQAAFDELDPQERAVLQAAGFGPGLLEIRDRTRPESMTWLDAHELRSGGVRFRAVMESGRDATAMEQLAAHVLRRDTDDPAMWRYLFAYVTARPYQAFQQLRALSDAQDREDTQAQVRLWQEIGDQARLFALRHAPDAAVVAWAREMVALLEPAIEANRQSACEELLGAEGARDLPIRDGRRKALTRLLEATPSGRAAAASPPALVEQARQLIRGSIRERIAQGLPTDYAQWSPVQQCTLLTHLWQASLRRPVPVAAAYVRYIELGD